MFDSTRLDMRLRLDPGELYRETTVDEARCAAPVARSSKARQDDVSPPSPFSTVQLRLALACGLALTLTLTP